jgi:hypothetical protein
VAGSKPMNSLQKALWLSLVFLVGERAAKNYPLARSLKRKVLGGAVRAPRGRFRAGWGGAQGEFLPAVFCASVAHRRLVGSSVPGKAQPQFIFVVWTGQAVSK